MIGTIISPLAKLADTVIDNLFETEEEKAAAKVKLMQAEQAGQLQTMQASMSAILPSPRSHSCFLSGPAWGRSLR